MLDFTLPFLIAMAFVLIAGGPTIAYLRSKKSVQPISPDAPEKHRLKHGTPTMGGVLILAAVLVTFVFEFCLGSVKAWGTGQNLLPLAAVTLTFVLGCGIGILDDVGKARKKENKAGLSETAKLALQLSVGVLFAVFLYFTQTPNFTTVLKIGPLVWDMGLLYYPFAVLYITVFANAVNFTDGLDGLLSGVTVVVATALGLLLHTTVGVAPFYFGVAGACAGFLWFNVFPARVFMGDTGSLGIGMGLSAAALVSKQEALLFLIGIIYIAEIVSMMIQRYVFKYRRITKGIEFAKANRVFRRAPLHHHFEELGMYETQVVVRFMLVTLIAAVVFCVFANQFTLPRMMQ